MHDRSFINLHMLLATLPKMEGIDAPKKPEAPEAIEPIATADLKDLFGAD